MAIDPVIVSNLNSLTTAVAAAAPLEDATRILIESLQEQGASLLSMIEGEFPEIGAPLDASDPSGFPGDMVATLLNLATATEDQSTLSDMRGLVGRAMFNLAQASP